MIEVYTQNINNTWLAVACDEQQIVASTFADVEQKALKSLLDNLPLNRPFQTFLIPSAFAKDTLALMADILEGKDVSSMRFDFVTDYLPGYTVGVLRAVMQIPVGYVSTYGAVARAVGGGPRAVGNVMAGNIFVPLIPCHRIVRGDFSLGGYGGGLKTKYQMLMKEKRGHFEHKDIIINKNNNDDGYGEGGCGLLRVYPVEETLQMLSYFKPLQL